MGLMAHNECLLRICDIFAKMFVAKQLRIAGMGSTPSIYVHERLEDGTELKKSGSLGSYLSEITVPVRPNYCFQFAFPRRITFCNLIFISHMLKRFDNNFSAKNHADFFARPRV